MKFTFVTEVAYPRDVVFEIQRDKLPELVHLLPNVERIERQRLGEEGGVLRVANEWFGSVEDIPAVARPFVRPEWTTWSDKAEWDSNKYQCRWQTFLRIFPGAIESIGTTQFDEEGDETVITITGEFNIDPTRVTGVPTAIARRVAPTLEKWIVRGLEPNMKRTFTAVEEYLDENG